MHPHPMRKLLLSVIGLITLGLTSGAAADSNTHHFDVTITNLTAHQVFTPLLVVSHTDDITLFTPGELASVPLEMLAEGGDTVPLADALRSSPKVLDVQSAQGPLPPGQSVTVKIKTYDHFKYVSVAGMLVPTNDAFVALNGVRGPRYGSVSFTVPAYDAGTEANDENCASIPGPPGVCGGEGFNMDRTNAEGFVHVHRGIHGGGDLDAATYDWRNPVARITIRRQ